MRRETEAEFTWRRGNSEQGIVEVHLMNLLMGWRLELHPPGLEDSMLLLIL